MKKGEGCCDVVTEMTSAKGLVASVSSGTHGYFNVSPSREGGLEGTWRDRLVPSTALGWNQLTQSLVLMQCSAFGLRSLLLLPALPAPLPPDPVGQPSATHGDAAQVGSCPALFSFVSKNAAKPARSLFAAAVKGNASRCSGDTIFVLPRCHPSPNALIHTRKLSA